jgi:hypothetical protein
MCDYNEIFKLVLASHDNAKKWNLAEFSKIKTVSNTKVGAVGQDFIEKICNELKLAIEFPLDTHGARLNQNPWDIKINGITFELKTATEDTSGCFQFNHVRYHRKYDALLCLGVSPNELYFQCWSKADVTTGNAGNLVSMEKNANASYKLTKKPNNLLPIIEFETRIKKFIENLKQN